MKKICSLLFLVSILFFSGCSDNDDEKIYEFYGTWVMTEYSRDGSNYTPWSFGETYIGFGADGSYRADGIFGDTRGRWSLAGNNSLDCYDGGEMVMKYRILDRQGDAITMKAISVQGTLFVKGQKLSDVSNLK